MATIDNTAGVAYRSGQNLEVRTSIVAANAAAQNTVFMMIPVYNGEVVMDVIVDYDNLGTSSAITVGDGSVAARFITSTTTTSAGHANINSAANVGRGYAYTADDTIDVTISGSGAATGNIRLTAYIKRTF